MKHSASGSMTESYEKTVEIPCEGNGRSVLQKLYIDLCNLIVESRIPGLNDRGYGDGVHCPPLLGSNKHVCDLSKPECQKHQTMIHHLLQAVVRDFFEIEVLLLPECCSESKLKERIQNNEYILLERWSINFTFGNKVESTVEVSQLLRAVRSFLHFSQISAWLSSTNGKSPANICYWVNPKLEALCTKFKHKPELHSFPICKIDEDFSGRVKVEFPARTQYIPIIPCSKHPPLCRYSLRAINEDSELYQNVPLNPQIVTQLHKTCNTEENKLTAINYAPETTNTVLDSETLLKSFSAVMSDGSKTNRVLKHSNSQDNLSTSSIIPIDLNSKAMDIIPKKPSTYVCNYAETVSLGFSQENLFYDKRRLARHLRKSELKLKKLKSLSVPLPSTNVIPILSSDVYKLNQNILRISENNSESLESNLCYTVSNSEKSLRRCIESSPVNLEKYPFPSSQNVCRQLTKRTKAIKRKVSEINTETICVFPGKRKYCDISLPIEKFKHPSQNCVASHTLNTNTSQMKDRVNKLSEKEMPKDNCSFLPVRPSNCSSDSKNCKEKHPFYSNFTFPTQSSSEILSPTQNLKFSNSQVDTVPNSSIHNKILNKSKASTSWLNSDVKLSKRTCISQLDDNETDSKKLKPQLFNDCKKLNLCIDSCTVSKSLLNKSKQKKCKVSENHEKNVSREEYLSKKTYLIDKELFKQECSTPSNILNCNVFKNSITEISSTTLNENSNLFCKTKYCVKGYKPNPKEKVSLNNSKCSLQLETLCEKMGNCQTRETIRKYTELCLASEQTDPEKSISNDTTDSNITKPIHVSRKNDFKTKNKPRMSIKHTLVKPSKKNPSLSLTSKSFFINNYSMLKSNRKEITEKTLHRTTLKHQKLNTLFKIRKCYQYKNSKRKHEKKNKQSCLQVNVESNSSQTSEEILSLSSTTEGQNMALKSVHQKTHTEAATDLKIQSTSGEISNLCPENNGSALKFGSNLSTAMISPQKDQSSFDLNTPVPTSSRNVCQITDENLKCFPCNPVKFPIERKLLVNFEESILKGFFPLVKNVKGFYAEIGASGSFCPNHLTLPADVSFYELGNPHQGTSPYVAHVSLKNPGYYLPKRGGIQVTLFNPSETVVKMFVLNYDLSSMPPLCHTFIRQKTYYLPVGLDKECPASQKWLRFIIHLRFASTKTGRIYLHEDFKIVVLNKSNDDAASEFNQEPRELCSFLSVPLNPTYSKI